MKVLLYPVSLLLILQFAPIQAEQAGAGTRCNRLIVKFKDQADLNQAPQNRLVQRVQHAAKNQPTKYRRTLGNGAYLFRRQALGTETTPSFRETLGTLREDPNVEYAECDSRRYIKGAQNDTAYANQWYLFDAAGGINAQNAWDTIDGSSNTTIAVIDTGVQSHSDVTRLLPGYDFVSDVDAANDGDGRDADPTDPGDWVSFAEKNTPGGPFNNDDCQESSGFSSWHGTMMNGIIAAQANNSFAIAGVDHRAMLLPVRAMGKCGGLTSDISDAIRWAAGLDVPGVPTNTTPADVINLSLGGQGSCSITEQSAIDAAVAAGATIVVAAGNGRVSTSNSAPANCNNVVVVAATTRQGGQTCYTNTGPEVDISAPGGNDNQGSCSGFNSDGIYSTTNSGITVPIAQTEQYGVGTSFAVPLVAGAIGLLEAQITALGLSYSPAQIEDVLKGSARSFPNNTTDSLQDCSTNLCGSGIVDIQGALAVITGGSVTADPFSFDQVLNVAINSNITSNPITVSGITIPVTVSISGGEYSIDGGPFTSASGPVNNGQTVRVRLTSSSNSLTATDATLTIGGQSATFSVTTQFIPVSSGGGGGGGYLSWSWFILLLLVYSAHLLCIEVNQTRRRQ